MKQSQRYPTFIFAALLALPLLSIITIQLYGLHLQHQALERLEKASLQTISIPLSKLVWEKKNREVNIDGELFDVKNFSVNGSEVVLTGLYDKKETAIKNFLKGQCGSFFDSVIGLLLIAQCFAAISFAGLTFFFYACLKKRTGFFKENILSFYYQLISPPPKAFCLAFPY